jgi:hypothetical protein
VFATPPPENLFGGFDILELVQTVPQEDDAPTLLKFLGKVAHVQFPIFAAKDLIGSIFQPSEIENAEELAALLVIEFGRAEVSEVLVGVDGGL